MFGGAGDPFLARPLKKADAPKYAYEILTRLGLLDDVGKAFRDADLREAGTAQWIDGFRDTVAKLVIAKGDPQTPRARRHRCTSQGHCNRTWTRTWTEKR